MKIRHSLLLVFVCMCMGATAQMRNNRLFKVDPAGLMFHELRVSVEQRLYKDYFWYLSPFGFHQSWLARDNERYERPTWPQKYYGVGIRAGARRYLFPQEVSPKGFFVQAMLHVRHTWMNNLDDRLDLVSRHRYGSLGLGAVVGYQWLYGPGFVPRKNFAYGVIGGFEFCQNIFPPNSSIDNSDLVRNWYQFPFLPVGFSRFRVYLGVELGFAFLQKRLHW